MHSKLFLSTLAYSVVVNAIPAATTSAPQASVTLYIGDPSDAVFVSGGTTQLDITVVGVSTGSAGPETTYSIGDYFSLHTSIGSLSDLPSKFKRRTPIQDDLQALSETSLKFSIMHSLKLLLSTLAYSAVVNAIPAATTSAPQASVTLYVGDPSDATIISGGTTQLDVTVVGVSTGSAGAETTYSIGEYLSLPATTIRSLPLLSEVQTQNYTIVESSAGGFLTVSNSMVDEIQTCSYASDGGSSASCVVHETLLLGSIRTETISTTFKGTKAPLTVLTQPTSTSSTSDAAKPRIRSSDWQKGGFILFFITLLLL
ncbi:hypothetical protein BDP27DRAFT_1449987 [Rhodocollybia butyracea]|uniref:Uncharacterized protein n=1 Tax=Rhodocollybia butyracea TaxID=206335 RepID=A0A9P5U4T3_9AGAR|nr:hypothetical protein BDP27DRAFT_1449987 [Rhodocollybia butyracea]